MNFNEYLDHLLETKKGSPKAKKRTRPNPVFQSTSSKVKDDKDHFPLGSLKQARNAVAQVAKYKSVPGWYSGSLSDLKKAVRAAVKREYPSIEVTE